MPSMGMNDPTEGEQMSNMNGSLEGIIEDLKRLHWAAENRVSEAQALYEQAKAERDHIARMLKAAGVQEEEAKPKQKAKPKGYPRVNDQTRLAVLKAIRLHKSYGKSAIDGVPGSFTVSTLEVEGLHPSSVRTAINNLRDDGVLRAVGKVPNSPRQAPLAYALTGEYPGEAGE
jgi:hypothetical protein